MNRLASTLALLLLLAAIAGGQSNISSPMETTGSPTASANDATLVFASTSLTTSQTVKSSAGNAYGYDVFNPNASLCYLEFFNTTSPTLGTTTPILNVAVPASSRSFLRSGSAALGNFSTAIAVAGTTAPKGGTTCTTGLVPNIFFK